MRAIPFQRFVGAGIGVTDVIVDLARRRGRRLWTPHIDDAGPFESIKNLLHQRMRRRIPRSLGLTHLRRLPQRRRG